MAKPTASGHNRGIGSANVKRALGITWNILFIYFYIYGFLSSRAEEKPKLHELSKKERRVHRRSEKDSSDVRSDTIKLWEKLRR